LRCQEVGRIRRWCRDDVDLPVLQSELACRHIDDRAEDQGVNFGDALRVPVFGVLGENNALAEHPLDELERARADRVIRDLLVPVLLDRSGADHPGRAVAALCQALQELRAGLLHCHFERCVIERAVACNILQPPGVDVGSQWEVVLETHVEQPVEVELGCGGIPGRSIVELDALAQMEGVDLLVIRDVPPLR
jgi:hypothetical protein